MERHTRTIKYTWDRGICNKNRMLVVETRIHRHQRLVSKSDKPYHNKYCKECTLISRYVSWHHLHSFASQMRHTADITTHCFTLLRKIRKLSIVSGIQRAFVIPASTFLSLSVKVRVRQSINWVVANHVQTEEICERQTLIAPENVFVCRLLSRPNSFITKTLRIRVVVGMLGRISNETWSSAPLNIHHRHN